MSLRFFTVYGPRQRPDMAFHIFLKALLEGRPLEIYGEGNQTRDFTFVGDIVDGIVLAMEGRDGAVYNLGGGSRVTLLEAIHSLEDASGCEARVQGESVQAGDVKHTWADLSLATAELGYAPRVALEEGLRREASGCGSCASDPLRSGRPRAESSAAEYDHRDGLAYGSGWQAQRRGSCSHGDRCLSLCGGPGVPERRRQRLAQQFLRLRCHLRDATAQ